MKREDAPLRVMVVEDTRLALEHILELIGTVRDPLTVRVAATEREGINLAFDVRPDIVILDLRLEQGNGFNILRRMGNLVPKPIAIVVTNFALPKYREYALLNGAQYFLDKARDLEKLPNILASIVRKLRNRKAEEEEE
jgi:DNA-binding NarL/FixJ family response regulator